MRVVVLLAVGLVIAGCAQTRMQWTGAAPDDIARTWKMCERLSVWTMEMSALPGFCRCMRASGLTEIPVPGEASTKCPPA